jgi:hypothetical protein
MSFHRRQNIELFDSGRRGAGWRVRRARLLRAMLIALAVPALVVLLIAGFNTLKGFIQPAAHHLTILGHDGEPLTGAIVTTPDGRQATSAEGGAAFIAFDTPAMIEVAAEGYRPATYDVQAVPPDSALALQMEPLVLQGRVTDRFGNGVIGATVTVGDREAQTIEFGGFEIVAAPPGEVTVSKSSWEDETFVWDGADGRVDVEMEPFIVRGLRVYGFTAEDDETFDELLRIADQTAVNALVFDTKSEGGEVLYRSQNEDAFKSEAILNLYDVEQRLAQAKAHGLYTITRIVTFQDFFMANYKPEHAITNSETGEPWTNWSGLGWMDPTDPGAWDYPIDLGIEACRLGFDEIQFDYVRFPTDGDLSTTVYDDPGVTTEEGRVEAVSGFLAEARRRINDAGCAVSADIFAIVLSVTNDQGLGQKIEELSWSVDALSPMVYPSHYTDGWLGFDDPNAHPSEVVGEALTKGVNRSEGGALIRPWLQGFSWTTEQVQESIMKAEELASGWMLWNVLSEYELEWIPDLDE